MAKVFVGNLSFKTREEGLKTAFQTAGKVLNAQIVTRGNSGRSLGYGFVEFENEDGAKKAIKDLNKLSLDEREINVELAKPRPEGAVQQPRRPFRRGPPRGYNQGYGRPYGQGNFQGGQGNYQGGYPGGGRRFPRNQGQGNYQGGQGNFQGGQGNYQGGYPGGGRRFPRNQGQRPPRTPRKPIEERNLQPSETTLFVTNLPFKYNDEDFAKIFVDAGIKPKSAKVALRFNGRSRGYGFVDFEKHEDQVKALSAVDKKTVDERELVVKIAMYDPNQQQKQAQGGQGQQAQPGQAQPAQQPKPAQSAQPTQQAQQAKPAQSAQPVQQPKPAQSPQPAQPAQPAKPAEAKPQAAQTSSPKVEKAASPKPNSDKKK